MAEQQLTANSDFVVKESVLLDLIIASIFYCMVISVIVYNSNIENSRSYFYNKILLWGLIPALIFTVKAIINPTAMTVNKDGIYIHKIFVTDWKHFKTAYTEQLPLEPGGYSDNEVLIVEYFKDSEDGFFERKLALTDTQNKSDEEITSAIDFFYNLSKR